MSKMPESNTGQQAQRIIRNLKKSSSIEDKANAGLALALLALISGENDTSIANQLLKSLKNLGY